VREVLLTINHVYWLVGATIYVGVLLTLRLFLYPGWHTLRPETTKDQFTAPTERATWFFLRAIPTWMFVAIVMIVTEWNDDELWLAIVAFLGLITTTCVGWFGIQPINREIQAGVQDEQRLTELLRKWMKINDLRLAAVVIMWAALCWYFVQKPDLPGALG
jgi:small-conductance mechanosensitive channel